MSLVSIVTPTRPGRENELLKRCIPSVAAQRTNQHVEHVIVSDPNPRLRRLLADREYGRFIEFNDLGMWPQAPSAWPWRLGTLLALGDYVGWCGDDDELLRNHVDSHLSAMASADADFSISKVEFRLHGEPKFIVGSGDVVRCQLDADGVMCRYETLRHGLWRPDLVEAEDYDMCQQWVDAGKRWAFVDKVTAIHHDGWLARV